MYAGNSVVFLIFIKLKKSSILPGLILNASICSRVMFLPIEAEPVGLYFGNKFSSSDFLSLLELKIV